MKPLDVETLREIASIFHGYPISSERAEKLAEEINLYLASIERFREMLAFDDAPADFDRYLQSLADQ